MKRGIRGRDVNHEVTLKRGDKGKGHESCGNIKRGLKGRDVSHEVTLKRGSRARDMNHVVI